MNTMDFTFTQVRKSTRFSVSDKNFKWMRRYMMSLNSTILEACFMHRLVDTLDDVKEMPEGKEIYFAIAPYDVFAFDSLEELNGGCKSIAEALGEKYLVSNFGGFKVKRTATNWIIGDLDYELN